MAKKVKIPKGTKKIKIKTNARWKVNIKLPKGMKMQKAKPKKMKISLYDLA